MKHIFYFLYAQYSHTWANNHIPITITCLQQLPFWSPSLSLYIMKLPSNNKLLSTTATNLGFPAWSLDTGLTEFRKLESKKLALENTRQGPKCSFLTDD